MWGPRGWWYTLRNSPSLLRLFGGGSSFPQLALVFLCKKNKQTMNLGLPQPTCLNSWVLPSGRHSTRETSPGGFCRGTDGTALCGSVNTGVLQKRGVRPALPGLHTDRPGRRPRAGGLEPRCGADCEQMGPTCSRKGGGPYVSTSVGGPEGVLGYTERKK